MTIQEQLYEKASAEYNALLERVKQLSPTEIINSAYEITMKTELLMCLEVGQVEKNDARVLLALDEPLDSIYYAWLDTDSSWLDDLRYCIDTVAENLQEEEERYVGQYKIIQSVNVSHSVFVLGHDPNAAQPYGVWQGNKSNPGSYSWGQHFAVREAAEAVFYRRIDNMTQSICATNRGSSGRG